MQRPLLRKPVCEIEEIFYEPTDVSPAEPPQTHRAPDEADASDSASTPSTATAGPPGARQPPANTTSEDDDDEFHDVLEPCQPPEAASSNSTSYSALSADTRDADESESFHDVEGPTPQFSSPVLEAFSASESTPSSTHPGSLAFPTRGPLLTTTSEPVAPSPEASASVLGKLPSPEQDRRVRPPQSGSRPYPPHSTELSRESQTVEGAKDGEGGGEEGVYQKGSEEDSLGSLPVAGAPEPREYSAEEMQASVEKAEVLKKDGNALYTAGEMEAAVEKYSEAIEAALEGAPQRAVYFANRAACQLKMKEWGPAASDCTRALEINPGYLKALARRCAAYQELDDLDRALTDAQKVLELDPKDAAMKNVVKKLEPIVEERREKMKDEMMGKLKDLGNTVLGKFGLSLDNFKAEKDPSTGSYSIQFNQS